MTLTVYTVPGRRPRSSAVLWSGRGAGRRSRSWPPGREYSTWYLETAPLGRAQEIRMELESTSEKLSCLGASMSEPLLKFIKKKRTKELLKKKVPKYLQRTQLAPWTVLGNRYRGGRGREP